VVPVTAALSSSSSSSFTNLKSTQILCDFLLKISICIVQWLVKLGSLCLCFLVTVCKIWIFVCEVRFSFVSCSDLVWGYIYSVVWSIWGVLVSLFFSLVNSFIVVSSARVYRSSGSDVSFPNGGVREIDWQRSRHGFFLSSKIQALRDPLGDYSLIFHHWFSSLGIIW